jgi:4-hydroxybenzoate polyprenyltransferase
MKWLHTLQKLILLERTLFGLPLALIGALLPFSNEEFVKTYPWEEWGRWIWVLLAFTAARTAGMAFNRLIDRDIDALNPRTKNRPLPRGEISYSQVAWVAWCSLLLFVYCCSRLNPMCFFFSPLIAFLIYAYSYTKRYTALCHFVLGLIEFFAPFLGWIAITGTWDWPPFFLGVAVLLWISGMDVVYSLQDVSFDRQYRLHSIPVAIGIRKSLLIARVLHALSVLMLVFAGLLAGVHYLYYVGLLLVSGLFIYQHILIKPSDLRKIRKAFFTCNSMIAVTQCVFTLGAILFETQFAFLNT